MSQWRNLFQYVVAHVAQSVSINVIVALSVWFAVVVTVAESVSVRVIVALPVSMEVTVAVVAK